MGASAAVVTTAADRRRQRRLQQADRFAAGLHQELQRHGGSGVTSPRSLAGSSTREAFGAVSNISPLTQRSSLPSGPVTPSAASSVGKASAARIKQLDKGIRQLSQRFAMRASLR